MYRMWHHIAQYILEIRRGRIRQSRQIAVRPIRRQRQRLMRLLSAPVLLLTMMTFSYLYVLSVSIELNQLIDSVAQPNINIANGMSNSDTQVQVVATATALPVILMTATPAPTAEIMSVAATTGQRIEAISIPAIGVDSVVTEVGWERILNASGESELVWQVAKYAVGHHFTSAAPGDKDNIVLSAHVGGYGRVFYRLNELRPDDEILLTSAGQVYKYRVGESLYLNEINATESEQIANLSYIHPTGSEMVTLVTCWPPSGPDRFSQRLIVRAWPVE